MTTTDLQQPDLDLGDLAFWLGDPMPVLRRMRRETPVVFDPTSGCWIVLRHADVRTAMRTSQTFSSAHGIHRPSARASAIDDYLAGSLIVSDPPEHSFLRRAALPSFSPRTIKALEARLRQMTAALLDDIEDGRSYDVVHDLAAHVPASIICELLGIPRADQLEVAATIELCGGGFDNRRPAEDAGTAPQRIFDYLDGLIDDRGDSEYDDFIWAISQRTEDGRSLTRREIVQFCFLLLIGGTDNTRATISSGVERLHRHPDQRELLRRDRSLLATATEEMVRHGSVASITARTVMHETELSGVTIPQGDMTLLVITSANYDEDVFGPDVEAFRVDRAPNPHLGWGFGVHACIGAPLARLSVTVFFDELLDRFASWEVGEPVLMGNFEHFSGFHGLPATFSRS